MQVEVFFDYTCPFCYVGHGYIKRLAQKYPHIEFVWRPCEAHPRPEPRLVVNPSPGWWNYLKPLADELGLVINDRHNPIPHSDVAMQGMLVVREMGGDVWKYHDRVYHAVFVDAQDIEQVDVLAHCAEGVGVDIEAFRAALTGGAYQQAQLQGNRYAFGEKEVWAVPAFVCGEKRLDSVEGIGISEEMLESYLKGL